MRRLTPRPHHKEQLQHHPDETRPGAAAEKPPPRPYSALTALRASWAPTAPRRRPHRASARASAATSTSSSKALRAAPRCWWLSRRWRFQRRRRSSRQRRRSSRQSAGSSSSGPRGALRAYGFYMHPVFGMVAYGAPPQMYARSAHADAAVLAHVQRRDGAVLADTERGRGALAHVERGGGFAHLGRGGTRRQGQGQPQMLKVSHTGQKH
jgi:hypothetical protein